MTRPAVWPQDVGLDGSDDARERDKFADYLSNFQGTVRERLDPGPLQR